MVELNPEEGHYYANASMAMLFDLADDIAELIGGECVARVDAAATEEEREQWMQHMFIFNKEKRALGVDDRDAVIAYIIRGRSECDRLRNEW
ncbi:hypothetical protein IDM40_25105 [Nocardiopsis sp. HNM0947]|uniref:Uncharacterized protein n=1 Tax=Nocardiopsis coralli TaxID=2772213 RepID=A0ABR9PDM9_9ACTN|nr:hypothetical protein [Nocardiopsis coralli]MBE3001949.1 hypothetical protein [Nocardiopsis coralli]